METTEGEREAHAALIGVFEPDQDLTVRAALTELRVPPAHVRVGAAPDRRASLRAEQVEESEQAIVAPPAGGAVPGIAARAMGWTMPACALAGAVLGALLALIPIGSTGFGTRLIWFGLLGILGGLVVAFVVTGAMASKDPYVAGEAQRGFVVRIDQAGPDVRERLVALGPIRLDLVDRDDQVLEVIVDEEDGRPGGALEELERNVERESTASPTERHR